jgi:hypothetical protein
MDKNFSRLISLPALQFQIPCLLKHAPFNGFLYGERKMFVLKFRNLANYLKYKFAGAI